jgi:hypothetical protein
VLVSDNPTLALDAVGPSTPTVKGRWLRDPIGQDRPQTGTTVGECGYLGVVGLADDAKASADQRRDVGAGLGDRSKHLPPAAGGLDVTDTDLQVPLALFAAADERRIQADSDG